MESIALLMFSWNEFEGVIRNVASLHDVVDEIVVIDSSDDVRFGKLETSLRNYDAKVYRFLPIGTVDLARGYALKKIRSDNVIYIDGDERVSEVLRKNLRNIKSVEAYLVPRYEVSLGTFTYHVRIYQKDKIYYSGFLHNTPRVSGRIARLNRTFSILHYANYADFYSGRQQRGVNLQTVIDSYQRVYSGYRVSRISRGKSILRLIPPSDKLLPLPLVVTLLYSDYVANVLSGAHPLLAKTNLVYAKARYAYTRTLAPNELARRLRLVREIDHAGGPIPYLCLDDVDYVENLMQTYRWNLAPLEIYEGLLDFRNRTGRCAPDLSTLSPTPKNL